jgi:hypothetical protein
MGAGPALKVPPSGEMRAASAVANSGRGRHDSAAWLELRASDHRQVLASVKRAAARRAVRAAISLGV